MSDGTGVNAASAMQERMKGLFADTLGMRFVEVTPERVRAELEVREELCTVPGIMHGGAIMAFADTLGGVATSLNLPPGAGTTTIESKTNFLAAARTGQTISGDCVPLHRGKQTLVWQTRVTVEDRLVALVTQTQIVLAPKSASGGPQEVLTALFAEKPLDEQKALLATLERAGAGLYRAWAANEADGAMKEALLAAAEREEENARTLESGGGSA
jgi:1,4-dihydroxy-2-naphthoyl-CoA hydrolase